MLSNIKISILTPTIYIINLSIKKHLLGQNTYWVIILNVYGLYKDSEDAAFQVLLKSEIDSLPVSLKKVAATYDFTVIPSNIVAEQFYPKGHAKVLLINHHWYIICDEKADPSQRRIAIAHEMGHILFGHNVFDNTFDMNDSEQETEADQFLLDLLAPTIVWKLGLGYKSESEIAAICNIPEESAKVQLIRSSGHYESIKTSYCPVVVAKAYKNFRPWIDSIVNPLPQEQS